MEAKVVALTRTWKQPGSRYMSLSRFPVFHVICARKANLTADIISYSAFRKPLKIRRDMPFVTPVGET